MKHGVQLILGGAWSGKTARAEFLARAHVRALWIGTGSRALPELDSHIKSLQAGRPPNWVQIDSPLNLVATLQDIKKQLDNSLLVIDSFSQWICNEVAHKAARHDDKQLMDLCKYEAEEFFSEIESLAKTNSILVVSADFGQSLPPHDAGQRAIRMCVGMTNARLGSISSSAELMQAGFTIHKYQRIT